MSQEIKRWDSLSGGMHECPVGEYVDFADYDRILQERDALQRRVQELEEAFVRLKPLLRMWTIGEVIKAGDAAIEATGLNPWCIAEGADPNQPIDLWWLPAPPDAGGQTK